MHLLLESVSRLNQAQAQMEYRKALKEQAQRWVGVGWDALDDGVSRAPWQGKGGIDACAAFGTSGPGPQAAPITPHEWQFDR